MNDKAYKLGKAIVAIAIGIGIAGAFWIGYSSSAKGAIDQDFILKNKTTSSRVIYGYTGKSCTGSRYSIYPGNSLDGARSFRSPIGGRVYWSNGTSNAINGNQCYNLKYNAVVGN